MLFHTKLFKWSGCVFKKSPPIQNIKTVTCGHWLEPSTEQEINFSSVTTSQNLWNVKRIALEGLFIWEWCELTSNQLGHNVKMQRWTLLGSNLNPQGRLPLYHVPRMVPLLWEPQKCIQYHFQDCSQKSLIQFQTLAWIFHFKCFLYSLRDCKKNVNVYSETETLLSKWDWKRTICVQQPFA